MIFFIACGLAMDAFAVAVAAGSSIREDRARHALRIGFSFGLFQMLMPLLGWFLGSRMKGVVQIVDHWIVFVLLVGIGIKMILESRSADCDKTNETLSARRLLFLSLATSIDALAVGMGFAFLNYPPFLSSVVIGTVTFILSTAGVIIGYWSCCVIGKRAELAGGIVLILIGVKILLDHLFP